MSRAWRNYLYKKFEKTDIPMQIQPRDCLYINLVRYSIWLQWYLSFLTQIKKTTTEIHLKSPDVKGSWMGNVYQSVGSQNLRGCVRIHLEQTHSHTYTRSPGMTYQDNANCLICQHTTPLPLDNWRIFRPRLDFSTLGKTCAYAQHLECCG